MEAPTPMTSLHDAATAYLDYCVQYRPKVYSEKRTVLRRLVQAFGKDTPVSAITLSKALDYLQGQRTKRTPNAANKERKNLAAMWAWCAKYMDGFPAGNPWAATPKFRYDVDPHYVPPEKDFRAVEALAQGQDKVLLTTFLHTAGRRSMVYGLRWADVDFARGLITLRHRKSRDGSEQKVIIPMTDELFEELMEHRRHAVNEWVFVQQRGRFIGQPYTENRGFPQDLCSLAKVKPFGCHGIRGLTASLLYDSGVPMEKIQRILGHARATTTAIYLRHMRGEADAKPYLQLLSRPEENKKPNKEPNTKETGPNAANV